MHKKAFFIGLAAILTLSGCTPLAMQVKDTIMADWEKHFGKPVDPRRNHIYNFDTFICDGARQIIVSFNPTGNKASLMFEKRQILVERDAPSMPFTQPPYAMYIMDDGTLLLEKHNDVIYKHCKPIINDPTVVPKEAVYDYMPTVTPEEAKADKLFREAMSK